MEQFVFLLIFAVIGFINWLIQKSAEKREAAKRASDATRQPPTPSPWQAPRPVSTPTDDFGEAARKLREALGLPSDAEDPRPVTRREEAPARSEELLRPEPPPLEREPAAPPAPKILFERKVREFEEDLEHRLVVTPPPPPIRPAARKVAPPVAPVPAAAGTLDDLLRSRDGLRKAILVQEVLGTPKGLVF